MIRERDSCEGRDETEGKEQRVYVREICESFLFLWDMSGNQS